MSAQEAGFYLKAIAIQESITSDRITSYLSYKAMLPIKKKPSFADLKREWKKISTMMPRGLAGRGNREHDLWCVLIFQARLDSQNKVI